MNLTLQRGARGSEIRFVRQWGPFRLIYDLGRFNTARLPVFHRLDLRVDRKFRFFGRNASLFGEVQNLYNHRSVIEYSWNQKTRELYAERQLGLLPVIGINVEF